MAAILCRPQCVKGKLVWLRESGFKPSLVGFTTAFSDRGVISSPSDMNDDCFLYMNTFDILEIILNYTYIFDIVNRWYHRLDQLASCYYYIAQSALMCDSTCFGNYILGVLWLAHSTLQWRHNGCDGVSNHQPHDCLLNCLFRHRSKKTSKLRVNDLCAGNSPEAGEFPAQMASNAENVSIWWRHHVATFIIL